MLLIDDMITDNLPVYIYRKLFVHTENNSNVYVVSVPYEIYEIHLMLYFE